MKPMFYAAMVLSLAVAGCSSKTGTDDGKSASQKSSSEPNQAAEVKPTGDDGKKEVALTPANTKIQFVGTHAKPKEPDPRTGHFGDFTGKAMIDGDKLTSVQVDIKTESLSTELEGLTKHLKTSDFFDVNEHPTATFQSTAIEPDGDKVNITGDLTLLGKTKSITFPATVAVKDDLSLKAAFTIDRTEFGMDFQPEGIEKEVKMTVTIGQ